MVVSEQPLCEVVELEAPELPLVSPRGIVELAPHTPPVQLFYRIEVAGMTRIFRSAGDPQPHDTNNSAIGMRR